MFDTHFVYFGPTLPVSGQLPGDTGKQVVSGYLEVILWVTAILTYVIAGLIIGIVLRLFYKLNECSVDKCCINWSTFSSK